MEYKEIIAVTGKSGLFKMVSPRQDGLIATKIGETKKSFLSSRKHNFTPLENIGIYLISGETIELSSVFNAINEQGEYPTPSGSPDDLRAFFDVIVPDYDEDRVKLSDMKKILQWFSILKEHELVDLIPATTNTDEEE